MTGADGARTSIHLDEFRRHPPAVVRRALTEPDLLARRLMPNDGWRGHVLDRLGQVLDALAA